MAQTIDDFQSFFVPDREKKAFNLKATALKTLSLIQATLSSRGLSLKTVWKKKFYLKAFRTNMLRCF